MSQESKKEEIMRKLRKSQENKSDTYIDFTVENIKNESIGMDVFNIDIDKLIAAPDEWNFYTPLNEQKMDELIESIIDNGLLNPIIAWEQDDGKYMILAGHNRVRAYKMIFEATKEEKFKKIFAYVKKKEDITENEARTIIIDTNFVQRELSLVEKTKSIVIKYNTLGRKKRNSGGKSTAEIIAEQYGIKERQVYNYYKLSNLIPDFMDKLTKNKINMMAALKLASLTKENQELINRTCQNTLKSKDIIAINTNDDVREIINRLRNKENKEVKIGFKVPESLECELLEYINKWFKNKGLDSKKYKI